MQNTLLILWGLFCVASVLADGMGMFLYLLVTSGVGWLLHLMLIRPLVRGMDEAEDWRQARADEKERAFRERFIRKENLQRQKKVHDNLLDRGVTGRDYELHCAQVFRKWGWQAEATQQSGDQGVDVIATYKKPNTANIHFKIAAQCKFHSKAVGNKAVQEILAGSLLHDADLGVVIAPNGFTRSAIELAEAVSVILLHQDEIPQILEALER